MPVCLCLRSKLLEVRGFVLLIHIPESFLPDGRCSVSICGKNEPLSRPAETPGGCALRSVVAHRGTGAASAGRARGSGSSLLDDEPKTAGESRELSCCCCDLQTPGTRGRSPATGNVGEEFILPGCLFWFLCVISCVDTEWVHSRESMRRRLET